MNFECLVAEKLFGAGLCGGSGGPDIVDQQDPSSYRVCGTQSSLEVRVSLRAFEARLSQAGRHTQRLHHGDSDGLSERSCLQAGQVEASVQSAGPGRGCGQHSVKVRLLEDVRHTVREHFCDRHGERSLAGLFGKTDGLSQQMFV